MLVRALRKCFHLSPYKPGEEFNWEGDPKDLPRHLERVAEGDKDKSASRLLDEAKAAQDKSHAAAFASSAQGVIAQANKGKTKPKKETAPAQAKQKED